MCHSLKNGLSSAFSFTTKESLTSILKYNCSYLHILSLAEKSHTEENLFEIKCRIYEKDEKPITTYKLIGLDARLDHVDSNELLLKVLSRILASFLDIPQ